MSKRLLQCGRPQSIHAVEGALLAAVEARLDSAVALLLPHRIRSYALDPPPSPYEQGAFVGAEGTQQWRDYTLLAAAARAGHVDVCRLIVRMDMGGAIAESMGDVTPYVRGNKKRSVLCRTRQVSSSAPPSCWRRRLIAVISPWWLISPMSAAWAIFCGRRHSSAIPTTIPLRSVNGGTGASPALG